MLAREDYSTKVNHPLLSLEEAASHCGFLRSSFLIWVRRHLLPTPIGSAWDAKSVNAAIADLVHNGAPGDGKNRRDCPYPNVQKIRRRLTDGRHTTHFYFRPSGTKLTGLPGSPEFMAVLVQCERQLCNKANRALPVKLSPSVQPEQSRHQSSQNQARNDALDDTKTDVPVYMTPEELCERWRGKIATETLANWRTKRLGPAYTKISKIVLYPLIEVQRWERANLVVFDDPVK